MNSSCAYGRLFLFAIQSGRILHLRLLPNIPALVVDGTVKFVFTQAWASSSSEEKLFDNLRTFCSLLPPTPTILWDRAIRCLVEMGTPCSSNRISGMDCRTERLYRLWRRANLLAALTPSNFAMASPTIEFRFLTNLSLLSIVILK